MRALEAQVPCHFFGGGAVMGPRGGATRRGGAIAVFFADLRPEWLFRPLCSGCFCSLFVDAVTPCMYFPAFQGGPQCGHLREVSQTLLPPPLPDSILFMEEASGRPALRMTGSHAPDVLRSWPHGRSIAQGMFSDLDTA